MTRYTVGFAGAGLWMLSWVFGIALHNHAGAYLMFVTGGLGYVLMFISAFLPKDSKK